MDRLTAANLRREAGSIVVAVPEPQELDFAVDLDSLRFVSKKNVTMALADWLQGRDLEAELRARIRTDALAFMTQHQLIPMRAAIVTRLNAWAPMISDALGVALKFE